MAIWTLLFQTPHYGSGVNSAAGLHLGIVSECHTLGLIASVLWQWTANEDGHLGLHLVFRTCVRFRTEIDLTTHNLYVARHHSVSCQWHCEEGWLQPYRDSTNTRSTTCWPECHWFNSFSTRCHCSILKLSNLTLMFDVFNTPLEELCHGVIKEEALGQDLGFGRSLPWTGSC